MSTPATVDTTHITADSTTLTADMIAYIEAVTGITVSAQTEDYLRLITSYHRPRKRFEATVATLVEPLAQLQDFLATMPAAFDLDTAVGVQLDVVGQWIGRSRYIATPLASLYFSFDDAPRGFDRGVWKGPFDSATGINRLDDETYRLLLRAKIAANQWDGTVPGAAAALGGVFASATGSRIFVDDKGDMSVVFGISGKIPSLLALALFSAGYIPLKPEAVKTYYLVTSADTKPMFGFDIANSYFDGFDAGAWGVAPSYFVDNPPV